MGNVSARQDSEGAAASSIVSGQAFSTPRLFAYETKYLNFRSINRVNIHYIENQFFLRRERFCAKLNRIVHEFVFLLNFRKFKVALNPTYRIFLNFAKSCILSCLTNSIIRKHFTARFLRYKRLKLKLRVF